MASLPIPEVEEIEVIYGLEGTETITTLHHDKAGRHEMTLSNVCQVLSTQPLAISG
jgi:hypothetical protein